MCNIGQPTFPLSELKTLENVIPIILFVYPLWKLIQKNNLKIKCPSKGYVYIKKGSHLAFHLL